MVIADATDAAAMAKWEHYKAGTDHEAIAWRDGQAEDDPSRDPLAGPNKRKTFGMQKMPTQGGVLVGPMPASPGYWTSWLRCRGWRVSCRRSTTS